MNFPSARDCHPAAPPSGGTYIVVSGGEEFRHLRDLDDARAFAVKYSAMGAACRIEHKHTDGTRCLVATYQYGSETHGGGI